jgi:AcrR family transcriptional regulator
VKSKRIKPKQRLTNEERRLAILEAVVPLFAEQGFAGVTTKLLARRAAVSEALLYRHFPSKEALYEEVQDYFCKREIDFEAVVTALSPGTPAIVALLHLFSRITLDPPAGLKFPGVFPRLMMMSVFGDGAFAKMHVERHVGPCLELLGTSLEVARKAGELTVESDGSGKDLLTILQGQLTIFATHFLTMPGSPHGAVATDRALLAERAVRFALRGMGFTAQAIKRHYKPADLDKALLRRIAARADGGEAAAISRTTEKEEAWHP